MDFRRKYMKKTLIIATLLTGLLLTACGTQATEASAPASPPTDESAPAEQAPTASPLPTDTAAPTEEPTPTDSPTSSGVSFANDIFPILDSRCKNCHGGDRGTEEGLDMTSYANLMAGSDNGPVVMPGDADNSLMVEMLLANKMPKRGPKLTPPQVQLIVDWINQGAVDN